MAETPFRLGYWLSSEEHPAARLVDLAAQAETEGYRTAMISDHFHPWTTTQGNAPFVWGVLGAIARATEHLEIGTGVTAPIRRLHPAIVAQAAATAATLMPGRFFLGVGTGEWLNEHVVGGPWPPVSVRREMLEEAVSIIRELLAGGNVNHRGQHYVVDNAELFGLTDGPTPPIFVAAGGRKSGALAGRIGDGLVSTAPSTKPVEAFEANGGTGKPKIGQLKVCCDRDGDEARARKTVLKVWPNGAINGGAMTELPRPQDFETLAELVREDDLTSSIVCGNDPERHLEGIAAFARAGYDTVYVHQIGPDQDAFFEFYAKEVLPRLATPQ
jgi:G6PDH family F420-dependent oxidoreductase